MDKEDLHKLWICRDCGSNFIFRSDVEDHRRMTGHNNVKKYDLLSDRLVDFK